ncbi:MAG: glycosyltransferase [Muribaculaceae bacterium]|nr:glycosyltransferase [Muribaculaceae bacterium]
MKARKQQILIVVDSLGCGGAEKSLAALLARLDYERMDVDLFVRTRGGINEAHIPAGVVMADYSPRGIMSLAARIRYSSALRMRRTHAHPAETEWKSTAFAYSVPRKTYDTAIAYHQGVPTLFVAHKVKARRKIAWINADLPNVGYSRAYLHGVYDKFHRVVAVSAALAHKISAYGFVRPDRLRVVYDIVEPDAVRALAEHSCPQIKPLPEGTLRIVTVGRLVAPKNYLLAVEVAALLRERGLRFVWHFVGDGDRRRDIADAIARHKLETHIRLEGMRPNPYPYFAAADIYVQTSRFEGFGLTLTEARLLGRPVVCTDFDVARDQIRDGINGLLAAMTPADVADKIMLLASDKALREAIAAEAAAEVNDTASTESAKVNSMILEP